MGGLQHVEAALEDEVPADRPLREVEDKAEAPPVPCVVCVYIYIYIERER